MTILLYKYVIYVSHVSAHRYSKSNATMFNVSQDTMKPPSPHGTTFVVPPSRSRTWAQNGFSCRRMPNGQHLVVRMGVASAISFEQDLVIVGETGGRRDGPARGPHKALMAQTQSGFAARTGRGRDLPAELSSLVPPGGLYDTVRRRDLARGAVDQVHCNRMCARTPPTAAKASSPST